MKKEKIVLKESPEEFQLDAVGIRLVKEASLYSELPIQTPYEAAATVGEVLCEMDREVICVVNLRSDLRPINVTFASVGALNEALASPRELLKASILSNASSIMLIHCHPSGNLLPSKQDTMMTDRMNSICELMGIQLIDHVIVGGNNREFFSFKEKGLMDNPKIQYATDYRQFQLGRGLVAEHEKGRSK